MTGNPNTLSALSNSKTIGKLSTNSNKSDNTTNFC